MAVLVWVSMGTALWHFTIFVPDRFAGGMVGAFVWANVGAILAGVASAGFTLPPLAAVSLLDAVVGFAGGLVGLITAYARGTGSPIAAPRLGAPSADRDIP